jgi:hypothetical protein
VITLAILLIVAPVQEPKDARALGTFPVPQPGFAHPCVKPLPLAQPKTAQPTVKI